LREWSTAVIASTTSLKLLSSLLKNNCGLYVCTHNVAELDEVRRVLNLTRDEADWIAERLQLGMGIVRWTEHYKLPFVLRFPTSIDGSPLEKQVTASEWELVRERARRIAPPEAPVTLMTTGQPAPALPPHTALEPRQVALKPHER